MGAAIAFRLARRGVGVALFDEGQPGHGASSHSFAWINAGAKEPIGYHNLNRRSLEMWPRFAAEIGDHGDPDSIGLRWGGKVSWESGPAAAEGLAARVRQLQSWGYPARLIDADELKRLEPSLDVGPVAAAEYSPNEGQVEPQMVVDACLRRLGESGCEIHANTEVHGFERSGDGRVRSLATAAGSKRRGCRGHRRWRQYHPPGGPGWRQRAAGAKPRRGDTHQSAASSAPQRAGGLRAAAGRWPPRDSPASVRRWPHDDR